MFMLSRTHRMLVPAMLILAATSLAGCNSNDDIVPTQFTFTPVTNAPLGSTQTSNEITVSDVNKPVTVLIAGGSYSVNGGTYTTASAQVKSGDHVTVQVTAAATPATTSSVQLTIGGTTAAYNVTTVDATTATTQGLASKLQNIVVIYAENRSFDNMFGHFPNANGIPATGISPQLDRDGSVLAKLPQTWGGVTVAGSAAVITQAQSDNLANAPFPIETAFQANGGGTPTLGTITRDLYHRFFENQMQINGGANNKFAAYGDSGGLLMGYWNTSATQLYGLASQYVLADNFFQAAFGGSFLNHQYLICACAPTYPNADTAAAHPTISVVDMNGTAFTHNLTLNTASASYKPSALDGIPCSRCRATSRR